MITGLIKANMPTRISFRLATKVDSRTIIDSNGAEALLGSGDMLYLPPGTSRVQRVHAPFVTEKEISAVMKFWKAQGEAEYVHGFLEGPKEDTGKENDGGSDGDDNDPMYRRCGAAGVRVWQGEHFAAAASSADRLWARGAPDRHDGQRWAGWAGGWIEAAGDSEVAELDQRSGCGDSLRAMVMHRLRGAEGHDRQDADDDQKNDPEQMRMTFGERSRVGALAERRIWLLRA